MTIGLLEAFGIMDGWREERASVLIVKDGGSSTWSGAVSGVLPDDGGVKFVELQSGNTERIFLVKSASFSHQLLETGAWDASIVAAFEDGTKLEFMHCRPAPRAFPTRE